MSTASAGAVIDRFPRLKVLVVGDLMLDHFVWGGVSRLSPEAPVPVVDVFRETEMPGGAGNVAVNLATLGAEVSLAGYLGEDSAAERLTALFRDHRIGVEAVVQSADRPTIVKTRIIAQHQQVVRVDREYKSAPSAALQSLFWGKIQSLLPHVDAVVLSDYAKGVFSEMLVRKLIPLALRQAIPITVDPKPEHFALYRHATCLTPNWQEALQATLPHLSANEIDIEEVGMKILKQLRSQSVLITRGERGMSLFEKGKKVYHIPTRARDVFDVTGAGDTVISTLTLALAGGAPLRLAAELANYAAGLVVGKMGTASVTADELVRALKKSNA